MRVVICIWRMGSGGAERQLLYLINGLRGRDVQLEVVTVLPGPNDAALDATGVHIHRIAAAGKYDPLVALRVLLLLRRLRPDVVHTYLTQMDIIAGGAANLLRVPWVLAERSSAAMYTSGILNSIRAFLGARADAIIANSAGGAAYWRTVVGARGRIHVIPNAVPESAIRAAVPVSDREAALTESDEVILVVGRLSPEKNLHVLLEALVPVLADAHRKAVFLGDGPAAAAVRQQAETLGLAGRVVFAGIVTNVWSWMKRARLLVSVSTFEGQPNAVLEAAAAGLPLVLSDIEGHRELFDDQCARFVDPRSATAIAQAISWVIDNREAAAERAGRARRRIGSASEDEIARAHEAVYREVAGSSGAEKETN